MFVVVDSLFLPRCCVLCVLCVSSIVVGCVLFVDCWLLYGVIVCCSLVVGCWLLIIVCGLLCVGVG